MARPRLADSSAALGIGLALLAFMLFSSMDAMIKWLSASYPVHEMLFFNAGFGLLTVALMTWRSGGLRELRTQRIGLHLLRACCGMTGGFSAFTAYSLMPLADAYAFIFTTPLLITVLSVPLLGETVRWRRGSAVVVGFIGVLIMLQPGSGSFDVAAGAALLAASASALSIILVRKLSATETTASIAFYTNATVAVVMACLLPIGFVPPALPDLALMALAGFTGGAALMLLIAGYRRAQAAAVAPFQYSQMLWGVLLGWLLWDDLPAPAVAVGASIVVASGLYILYREVVRAEGRPEPVAATPAAPAAVDLVSAAAD
ncbi:MAG TPA: DMT family transporter [Geminicoccaceae bacterium]|nr:DMT family transporter [Geminicoccaceae bacterium]